MLNLYSLATKSEPGESLLTSREKFSLLYHNLFDYPLNLADLIRWLPALDALLLDNDIQTAAKNGYFYMEGREGLIYKRLLRKRISAKKLAIANKAARVLSFLPGIQMIGVTGSLAMENSTDDSDIDLILVTKKGVLWTTRLFAYSLIRLFGIQTRRPMDKIQKDKLCLNMWMDESDLAWSKKDRNLYTAHEIAQIVPLVNKAKTHERFLVKNKWLLNFWPHAVKIVNCKLRIVNSTPNVLEKVCYKLQLQYMKKKISREVVTPTRALFHPQDWGKVVMERLRNI